MDEASSEKSTENVHYKFAKYLENSEKLKNLLRDKGEKKKEVTAELGGAGKKSEEEDHKSESDDEDLEIKEFINNLRSVIDIEKPSIKWSDIAGLEAEKEVLKEAVIIPNEFPLLFTGKRVTGTLLYGAPGTGKTILAKAVANEAKNSTFLSVSSSNLISRWLGEKERLVKASFDMARHMKPAIIFIDDVDLLCSLQSGSESESVRKELNAQMQGIGVDNDGVQVLAASSVPWVLDADIRRRFEKRIYIPLPHQSARAKMFELNIGKAPNNLRPEDYEELGKRTDRYSGADISCVVTEALMLPVKKIQMATHFKRVQGASHSDPNVMVDDLLIPCATDDPAALEMNWMDVPTDKLFDPIVSMENMLSALQTTQPSVTEQDLEKHKKFMEEFGLGG